MRHYGLILAATLAALTIGYWLGHGTTPAARNVAPDTGATAASSKPNTVAKKGAAPSRTNIASPTAQARAPLPAPGTPLRQTMSELQARAAASDAEAASRLYHDTQRCAQFRRMKVSAPRLAEIALSDTVKKDSKPSASNTAFLDMAQKELDFVRDNTAFCVGIEESDVVPIILPTALQAALLGDTDAADCYISGGGTFGVPPGLLDHPEWLGDYKQNALAIATAAIKKGDWIMVSQLANAYELPMPSLLQQTIGQDSNLAYRYLKLSRLGAPNDGDAVNYLDARLTALAKDLSPDVRTSADAWAHDTYQRYFAANPHNPSYNSYRTCHVDGL